MMAALSYKRNFSSLPRLMVLRRITSIFRLGAPFLLSPCPRCTSVIAGVMREPTFQNLLERRGGVAGSSPALFLAKIPLAGRKLYSIGG